MKTNDLRAKAHALKPVVLIGDKGLTDGVVAEVDRALAAHELIKVKAASASREDRAAWMAAICERLAAQPVQSIGRILVLYRENPGKAKPEPPPRAAVRPPRKAAKPRRPAAKTPRPEARPPKKRTGWKRPPAGPVPAGGPKRDFRKGARPPSTDDEPKREFRKGRPQPAVGSEAATGSARRRSRTPSPLPASGPRRRRPSTSR